MKLSHLLLCGTLCVTGNSFAESAKGSPKKVIAKKKQVKSKKVAKKKVESRKPAAEEVVVQVFSETTDFESLVKHQAEIARRPAGFSGKARVIGLRRELGLTRSEADSAPQDIVLNAGAKEGVSQGMLLTVARKVPVLDPYKDNQQSELTVKFASIRVVHVEEDLAVARIEKIDPIRAAVGIGVRGVLVGDYVQ